MMHHLHMFPFQQASGSFAGEHFILAGEQTRTPDHTDLQMAILQSELRKSHPSYLTIPGGHFA